MHSSSGGSFWSDQAGLLVGVALAGFLQFLRATGAPNLAIGEGSWLSSILARSSTWAEQTDAVSGGCCCAA